MVSKGFNSLRFILISILFLSLFCLFTTPGSSDDDSPLERCMQRCYDQLIQCMDNYNIPFPVCVENYNTCLDICFALYN